MVVTLVFTVVNIFLVRHFANLNHAYFNAGWLMLILLKKIKIKNKGHPNHVFSLTAHAPLHHIMVWLNHPELSTYFILNMIVYFDSLVPLIIQKRGHSENLI